MSSLCAVAQQPTGFVSSTAAFIDCQAQALGSNSYQALLLPGSTLQLVLSGFLTILIALFGYRLLIGRAVTLQSATSIAVRAGIVFALATSWPIYRTLVYDVVVDGPGEVVADIAPASGLPAAASTLVQRLDLADGALAQLVIVGAGNPMNAPPGMGAVPPPFSGFNAFALGGSRILFLITSIFALGAVRVVAGLMLALGPFFLSFLLFENTRGLFEGWVRVLAGTALASVGVTIALGLELGLMEPWLSVILARRAGGESLPSMPSEIFVASWVFAMLVFAAMFACARVARGFRLAPLLPSSQWLELGGANVNSGRSVLGLSATGDSVIERSRAAAVADVLIARQRRESTIGALSASPRISAGSSVADRRDGGGNWRTGVPVGRSFPRRARVRVSSSATSRDSK